MTPFEIDLLKTAWPYIWTGILSAGAWFLRSQSARLDKICVAMNAFNADVSRIEADLQAQRARQQSVLQLAEVQKTRSHELLSLGAGSQEAADAAGMPCILVEPA